MSLQTLHAQLECELPEMIEVGHGTALFVCGWCFCPQGRIAALEFVLDSERQPVMAHSMPRIDPFRALHPRLDPFETHSLSSDPSSDEDPLLLSYRSGFWGIVRVEPEQAHRRQLELSLRAELAGGGEALTTLASIDVDRAPHPIAIDWPEGGSGPNVAICMATYNPPADLLARQLDSIRSQTHRQWVCLISDDGSRPESVSELHRAIGDDNRFIISQSPRRQGFYRNFERALALAPRDAAYVAIADQDDCWRADKLAQLLAGIGDAQLAYSDARVVSRTGELISETWWDTRRNNHSDLLSLLVANSVTGAASLLRRELLDLALPFPPAQFAHFHDHWIGLVALATGDIRFIDAPLYDYVQHEHASLGHVAANLMTSLPARLLHQRPPRERVRMWRLHYFVDVCRLLQFASILQMRCWDEMTPEKRRSLRAFLDGERSGRVLVRLALRGARELIASVPLRGARELIGKPETLGAEWMLFHALAWRRLVSWSARERPQRRMRLDALPPPALIQQPGRTQLHPQAATIGEKIAPLRWAPSDAAPVRVNLLLPTIDLRHFFGGYIAKFNLARRLAERGLRVRIVTVDPVGALPPRWKDQVESYSGLAGALDRIEVTFGRESGGIEINPADAIIATTWWTAHIARDALEVLATDRFLYLIQEYEPFTFPMGTFAALAEQSYTFPHFAVFSSELLREYFRRHRLGVFAQDAASVSFQNALTPLDPPSAHELGARTRRRLLFYARPEPHAARNMFELGVLALARALALGAFRSGWELHGIGTVEQRTRIALSEGMALELLPRADQEAYARLLRDHDVGLALMYTPHPSLVPIEMASAGMLAVTNTFENKTAEALHGISANLLAAAPTIDSVASALVEAAGRVEDAAARVAGAHVNWSRDWEEAFPAELLDTIVKWLATRALRA